MPVSTRLKVKELLRERRWTTKVLAEKTGMSESYLTHIKNGTRRWNEDALAKLAKAFELHPTELFDEQSDLPKLESAVNIPDASELDELSKKVDIQLKIVPVLTEIPSQPNDYNNRVLQVACGNKNEFVPVIGSSDKSMFSYQIQDSSFAPRFLKGDLLVISPESWTRSGDLVAVEYVKDEEAIRTITQVNYMDDFVILESVNHKSAPIALVKGKDQFRIIGKITHRYQKLV